MFDFIARPFGMLLNFLYEIIGSYGISLIIFTILAKLVLLPFQMKSKKSMIGMQKIQPKMKELEKKYKDDKERYAVAVQQLYKDEGVKSVVDNKDGKLNVDDVNILSTVDTSKIGTYEVSYIIQ